MQAVRVLLYDMVVSRPEFAAQQLPRLAAAALSWPEALPLRNPSGDTLGPALAAAMQDLCQKVLQQQSRAVDDTVTAQGSGSGTTSAVELQPGVHAAAEVLLAVLVERGAAENCEASERWPASVAALKQTIAAAARLGGEPGTDSDARSDDRWHDCFCALRVAAVCLGHERCFSQVRFWQSDIWKAYNLQSTFYGEILCLYFVLSMYYIDPAFVYLLQAAASGAHDYVIEMLSVNKMEGISQQET